MFGFSVKNIISYQLSNPITFPRKSLSMFACKYVDLIICIAFLLNFEAKLVVLFKIQKKHPYLYLN